jgi:hypothetical protein
LMDYGGVADGEAVKWVVARPRREVLLLFGLARSSGTLDCGLHRSTIPSSGYG